MSDGSSPKKTSAVVAAWKHLTRAATTDESWVGSQTQYLSTFLSATVRGSGLATIAIVLAQWVRTSFLYRWLTAEPDPEVIVIDLRETYTVGPILALFDRVVGTLSRGWHTASIESLAQATHEALRDHPIRTVSLVALVALLTSLIVSVALGTPTATGLGVRLIGIGLAALGTRIYVSWDQCTESATYRYLVAALEPPEPPDSNGFKDDSES